MLRNTTPQVVISGRSGGSPTQPYRGAHFATFPETLPELCITAGTSERGACAECGTPWVERSGRLEVPLAARGNSRHRWCRVAPTSPTPRMHDGSYRRVDLGFRKRCSCATTDTVPCLVLDPFAGSGTVLAVARRTGPEVHRHRTQSRVCDSRAPPLGGRGSWCCRRRRVASA